MEMKYFSTRGKAETVSSAQAILQGIAEDGGLFVPTEIPKVDANFLQELVGLSYAERAKKILGLYLTDYTDEEIARRTRLDVHSLAVNRVNVSVKNFQSFFDAFGIKEGDPMWRPESERVHIW